MARFALGAACAAALVLLSVVALSGGGSGGRVVLAGAAPPIVAAPVWGSSAEAAVGRGVREGRRAVATDGAATARRVGAVKGVRGAMPAHIQQMRAMAESAPAADGGWQELSAADGDVRVHQVPPTMGEVPRASATSTSSGSVSGYPHSASHHFVASRPYEEHPETSGSPHEGHGRPLPPTRFNPVRVPAPAVAGPDYLSDGEHSEDSAISRAAALVSEAIKHHEARQAAMEKHHERTQAFADSIRADINTFYAAPVPANPAEHAMSGMRRKVGKEQSKVRSCHPPSLNPKP